MGKLIIPGGFALTAVATALLAMSPASGESARLVPAAQKVLPGPGASETAVFAGGCFWGVEGVFEHVRGVKSAVSGYAGGNVGRPSYEQVSSGATGAAEAVRVTFDPRVVRYTDLLRIYFSVVADPTLKNRQGPDSGTQYRTALFPQSAAQTAQARAYIAQLGAAKVYARPIVTTLERGGFATAEAYHQDYMRKNPNAFYIVANDRPKVTALKQYFASLYRG